MGSESSGKSCSMKAQVLSIVSTTFIACCSACPAQDQERFSFLFEKFTEIARKAEEKKDFQTACGMYEAALENTSFSKAERSKHAETLASIIRCYTKNGYYWRIKPFMNKLLAVLEVDLNLITPAVREVLTSYSDLLAKLGKETDARIFQIAIERLNAKEALADQSQER